MKNLTIYLLLVLSGACNTTTKNNTNGHRKIILPKQEKTIVKDTTPRVLDIGGVFFQSRNPKEKMSHYLIALKHLNMENLFTSWI